VVAPSGGDRPTATCEDELMLGIGGPELVVILVVGLIFIGPDKLPKVAKSVGAGLRDLRRAANLAQAELRETMDDLIREADLEELRDAQPRDRKPKTDTPKAAESVQDAGSEAEENTAEAAVELAQDFDEDHDDDGLDDDDDIDEDDGGDGFGGDGFGEADAAGQAKEPDEPVEVEDSRSSSRLRSRGHKAPDPGFSFDDDEPVDPADDVVPPPKADPLEANAAPTAPPPAEPPPTKPPPSAPPPTAPGPAGTVARSMPPMRAGASIPATDVPATDVPATDAAAGQDEPEGAAS